MSTKELQTELEDIIAWFESHDADIDQAAEKYQKGLEIAQEIQKRLNQAENKIMTIKKSFEEA